MYILKNSFLFAARNRRKSETKLPTSLPLPPQLTPSQLQNSGTNLPPTSAYGGQLPGAGGGLHYAAQLGKPATTNTTAVLPGTVPSANIKFGDDPAAALATAAAAQAAAANTAAVVAATTATQPTAAVKAGRQAADQPTEKKRGPGRPPGSTKQSIEQQRLMQQQNGSKFSSSKLIKMVYTRQDS